jgi:hypothetical protein
MEVPEPSTYALLGGVGDEGWRFKELKWRVVLARHFVCEGERRGRLAFTEASGGGTDFFSDLRTRSTGVSGRFVPFAGVYGSRFVRIVNKLRIIGLKSGVSVFNPSGS